MDTHHYRPMMIPRLIAPSLLLPKWDGFATPFGIVIRHNTPRLIRHEECHVRQWWRYWIVGFAVLYLYYLWRDGYTNNPFEIEAREAENG